MRFWNFKTLVNDTYSPPCYLKASLKFFGAPSLICKTFPLTKIYTRVYWHTGKNMNRCTNLGYHFYLSRVLWGIINCFLCVHETNHKNNKKKLKKHDWLIDLNLSKAASYKYLCHSLKWSANFLGYLFPRSLALRVIVYSVTEWKVLRIKWCQTSIVSEIFWDLSCRLKVNYKNSFKALNIWSGL